MKKQHKLILAILIIVTIVSFIGFNLFYKESMTMNAIEETNPGSDSIK